MVRSFALGLGSYAISAIVFIVFSIVFVRAYGASAYGEFSILLNTVSALTLFGNYHGSLVSFSAAGERTAFFRMLRPVSAYAIVSAGVAGAALAAIGALSWIWALLSAVAFFVIVASGLPTAALMASSSNWHVNVSRAVYQVLLIAGFWLLFATGIELGAAFVLGLAGAALGYLSYIASRVSFSAAPASTKPAPKGILLFTLGWNLAVMATMLLDKVAIRLLNVGPSAADVGLFLLYYDIAGRLCAVYAIALTPFTYEILQRTRQGRSIVSIVSVGVAASVIIGVAGLAVGELLIPALYGIALGLNVWLPTATAASVVLVGFSTVLLAYCNATGRVHFLLWHYVSVFVVAAGAIAAFHALSRPITVAQLALALMLGQSCTILSAWLVVRSSRAKAGSAPARGFVPMALQAAPKV